MSKTYKWNFVYRSSIAYINHTKYMHKNNLKAALHNRTSIKTI